MIDQIYLSQFKRELNWETPKLFTEKIQWLKLNYRNPLMTVCADKVEVHKYIEECGCGQYLNKILNVWTDVENIDVDSLPEKFVLKAAHGSSMNLIVDNKNEVSWFIWKKIMKLWLKQNIYIDGREWPYKHVKPRIVCEAFIETGGLDLKDYKFFCFNGEPKIIQVDGERFTKHKRGFYDETWNYLPFQYSDYDLGYKVDIPDKLEEMIELSRKISKPFPFARIDFYNIGDKIIFGEITFSPDSGFGVFKPCKYDEILGSYLKLPKYLT